jgi:molecular chaperone DnaJ
MDFYLVLGLGREATVGDIKRAYRRLARRYHPDINPGDRLAATQFRQIAEAYETLSDPDRRRQYDTGTGIGGPEEPRIYGFEGFDFSVSAHGNTASTFGELFAEVFRQRAETQTTGEPERGADLHQVVALSFEEAMIGGQRSLTVTRLHPCSVCEGAGWLRTAERRCHQCQGAGVLKSARGHMVFSKPCDGCHGSGLQSATACMSCGGQQFERRTGTLTMALPAGLEDGAQVRIPGKGHAGPNNGDPGDVFLTVRVEPHPVFRREGDDLHVVVPIAIHEAALGAKLDVPALDGRARLRVPPGTQSGQRFRLRERGVPSARTGRRGDLVAEVRLVLPRLLDERSKELLREFGRLNGDDVRKDLHRTGDRS